ncbi:Protein CBG16287 [Caenorhabditis briggsae]|uniref:Protein CBG16287 n=1 Tax=Caenorhabditis briggsae TaxID=6238 RepID=A8XNQ9_CAEBR|nr:Protein CBG16287 [Caenorhabditis briggsae]CAP34148.2 Protein CBG16287 [Caenorhabditis briggsae]
MAYETNNEIIVDLGVKPTGIMIDYSHQLIHRSKDIPLSKPRFSWNYLEFPENVKYEVIRDGFNITYHFDTASSPSVGVILENLEGKFAHILEERENEKRNRAVHIILIIISVFLIWHTTIWFFCVWCQVCKSTRYRKRLRRRIEREEENNLNIISLLDFDQQSSGTAYHSVHSVDNDTFIPCPYHFFSTNPKFLIQPTQFPVFSILLFPLRHSRPGYTVSRYTNWPDCISSFQIHFAHEVCFNH